MNFKIGQKVCCINDNWFCTPQYTGPSPMKGEVVTVANVKQEIQTVWIDFVEYSDAWFLASHFRPLTETSIDIFHAILANPHKKVMEEV